MATRITKAASILFLFMLILSSCSKEPVLPPGNGGGTPPPPPPPVPVERALVSFTTNADLTGQPYHSSNLQAVVTIVNDKNEEVAKEKMLTLSLPNPVKTQAIELPVGNYKLTSFRMVYGGVNTHFATPIAGSAKASQVQKPLALDFKVEKSGSNEVGVEVLKVKEGEKPSSYGYPSGAFDNGQEDANPYMKLKLRAVLKIGEVIYDSVPASLRITTWNDKNEMNTTYGQLKAGVNEVSVLKAAVRYEFRINKWGIDDAMTLDRNNVDESTVYTLGGSRDAKKLKSERVYKIVNGTDVPESKTDYFYDGAGKLSRIEYWMRKQDNTPYLAMTDRFEYSASRVDKISRMDEESKAVIKLTSFGYDNQGKVISMWEKENSVETNATVSCSSSPLQEVSIHYKSPGQDYDINYNMVFNRGNMISSAATTANHTSELGTYDHDLNINPYIHMNWHNLYLSNSSKNNMTVQRKQYFGSYPTAEPFNFSYTYDADGYPTQVVKQFRSYPGGNIVFSTKTVFIY
jgi:hypothetical protein